MQEGVLTDTDLRKITRIVRTEVRAEVRKEVGAEVSKQLDKKLKDYPTRKEMNARFKKLEAKVDTFMSLFDRELMDLYKRVVRLESVQAKDA